MQIYTAFFLGALTGLIVNDKTLSSGCLVQMGLRLGRLISETLIKQPWHTWRSLNKEAQEQSSCISQRV